MLSVSMNQYGTMVINAEAEVFIIPNRAPKYSDFLFGADSKLKVAERMTGGKFDKENEHFIECWIVSKEDLHSDNVNDHGFSFRINDNKYLGNYISRYIPESIFKDHKEGDFVDLVYDTSIYDTNKNNDEDNIKAELHLHTKLNQLDYRYRRFGAFENVLDTVTR